MESSRRRPDGSRGRKTVSARQRHHHTVQHRRAGLGRGRAPANSTRAADAARARRWRWLRIKRRLDAVFDHGREQQEEQARRPAKGTGQESQSSRCGNGLAGGAGALSDGPLPAAGLKTISFRRVRESLGSEAEGRRRQNYLPRRGGVLPRRPCPAWCATRQSSIPLIDDAACKKGWPLKRIDAILRAGIACGFVRTRKPQGRARAAVVVSEYVDWSRIAFVDGDETGHGE